MTHNTHKHMQIYSEIIFKTTHCIVLELQVSEAIQTSRKVSSSSADEPLIVHTGSGSFLTVPRWYFDLYFMRTVKARQVQQESTSDKSHLLLVSSSVRQTDAIFLLNRLYDPNMTIAGQIWKFILCCARYVLYMCHIKIYGYNLA